MSKCPSCRQEQLSPRLCTGVSFCIRLALLVDTLLFSLVAHRWGVAHFWLILEKRIGSKGRGLHRQEGERRLKDEIVFNSLEIISRVEKLRAGARKGSDKSRSKMDVRSEFQSLWTQSLGSKLSFCGLCMWQRRKMASMLSAILVNSSGVYINWENLYP